MTRNNIIEATLYSIYWASFSLIETMERHSCNNYTIFYYCRGIYFTNCILHEHANKNKTYSLPDKAEVITTGISLSCSTGVKGYQYSFRERVRKTVINAKRCWKLFNRYHLHSIISFKRISQARVKHAVRWYVDEGKREKKIMHFRLAFNQFLRNDCFYLIW